MKRVQAVIFDWAGTTVDHGSMAPVKAVTELFARRGIHLNASDVRRDMGLYKKDHIRRILALPDVRLAWEQETRRLPSEQDVDALFAEFGPLQMEVLAAYSQLIAGTAGMAGRLRGHGIKLGSTTGYPRQMLDVVLAHAAEQGYRPDTALCPDDTGGGRPRPWMCLRLACEFRIDATSAAVKVGDTAADIAEGLNAGMWAVGVTDTGNEAARTAEDWGALPVEVRRRISAQAAANLKAAGAHYTIESVSQLEPVLEAIEGRLAAGDRP